MFACSLQLIILYLIMILFLKILLGDGKGMFHYVYFLLSGECQLIEHMLVKKKKVGKTMQYSIYDYQEEDKNPRQRISRAEKPQLTMKNLSTLLLDDATLVMHYSLMKMYHFHFLFLLYLIFRKRYCGQIQFQ
jgi:hypothetical protein